MTTEDSIRVLVVDDSAVYRRIISDILVELPDVEVVGTASNGQRGLEQIKALRPDLVTLDVEMPVMDGLELLRRLQAERVDTGVIMLSSTTARGSRATMTALQQGALDFVLKPDGGSLEENRKQLYAALKSKVRDLGQARRIHRLLGGSATPGPAPPPSIPPTEAADRSESDPLGEVLRMQRSINEFLSAPRVAAVGVSTGGPQALQRMLPRLPEDLPVPVLIVQHMPPLFTRSLAEDLDRRCRLNVVEASDGMEPAAGRVLIAPGGRQMKVVLQSGLARIRLTDDPPENSCRPSVDYLFRSVADVYGGDSLAVIMTGMGNDGAAGCREIKRRGGTVIAQDEASCIVFGMPREPIEEQLADRIGPPETLADEIQRLTRGKAAACPCPPDK